MTFMNYLSDLPVSPRFDLGENSSFRRRAGS
jgi:hypothetical protein